MIVRHAVAMILALALAAPAAAQTDPPPADGGARWGLYDAVGYGGLGFGLGLAAAWDMEGSGFGPPGEALALIGATTVAGVVAGALIGHRAGDAVADGREVGGAHRAATLGGVVLAGAALGTLAAVPLVNGEGEGTPLGSDEQTVALLTAAGGALGAVFAWHQSDKLAPRGVSLTPTVTGSAEYGMRLRIRF